MHWLRDNWFWLAGILFVWVHARTHARHHHHGHRGDTHHEEYDDPVGRSCHAHATREDSHAQR